MHPCTCIFCGLKFDRDKVATVQVTNRRYAHKECAEKSLSQKSKEESDYDKLISYIKQILGDQYIAVKVAKQIKDFREEYGYTYSGILGTLTYWYEVRGANHEGANGGIGIVPYAYNDARDYYNKLRLAQEINLNIENYKPKVMEITILPPQPQETPIKLFKLEEGE